MEMIIAILLVLMLGVSVALWLRKPAGTNTLAEGRAEALQQQVASLQQEKATLLKENQQLATERAQLVERERAAQEAKADAFLQAQESDKKANAASDAHRAALILNDSNMQKLAFAEKLLADNKGENQKLLEAGQALRTEHNQTLAAFAELKGKFDGLQKQLAERNETLKQEIEQLQERFKLTMNELVDAKTRSLTEDNKASVQEIMAPVRERLLEFSTRVEDLNKQSAEQHGSLKAELGQIQQLNQALTQEAHNLSQALRGDAKVMGDWGEVTLERVLQAAGLSEHMYTKQDVMPGREGDEGTLRSDFLIRLPEDRFIVIDSKVSLKSYVDYTSAHTDVDKASASQDLLRSLQSHIQKLAESEYHARVNSPEFTFMFVPHDPIFNLAVQLDPNLVSKAYQKKVLMVTPSTLVVALKVVMDLWQRDTMAKNQIRLAELAGEIYNKLSDGLKNLTRVGDSLDTAQKSYSDAIKQLATGKGNILSKAEEIKRLASRRVKVTKSLETSVPKLFAEAMESDDISLEEEDSLPFGALSQEENTDLFS